MRYGVGLFVESRVFGGLTEWLSWDEYPTSSGSKPQSPHGLGVA